MRQFNVTGMSCAACSARVEKAVSAVPGVSEAAVNLLTNSMAVEGTASDGDIIAAVVKAGYGASVKGAPGEGGGTAKRRAEEAALEDRETPKLVRRLIVSVGLLLILMYFSMGHTMWHFPLPAFLHGDPVAVGLIQLLLSAAVMVINQRFFISGTKALIHRSPNMDTLVSLGSAASFLWSVYVLFVMSGECARGDMAAAMGGLHELYFESAAMILALITVGKMLEARSKGKTTDALKSLMALAPKTAVIIENGAERTVPVEQVKKGDIFAVRPGESIPVDKSAGSAVSAATVNTSGYLRCEATRVGEDTALSKIIRMVEDASATKAPIAKIADRVSGIFVPVVIGIALVTFTVWMLLGRGAGFALARAISVLVISCPCALGLATPVAIMVGSGKAAKNGILFKTAVSLEEAGKVQIVALDKTGTVTKGEPNVTDIVPAPGVSEAELIEYAVSLEKKSEHPLALAVLEYAGGVNAPAKEVTDFTALPGHGLTAKLGGKTLAGGSLKYISGAARIAPEMSEKALALAEQGKTPLLFTRDGELLGIIAVADTIKEDSAQAVNELKNMGVRVVMLTGDNERTAKAIGAQAGVDEVVAGVLPDGKERVIRALAGSGKVAMVGDGINDAPALTRADIGVAIGAGTDIAIDAADVVLMKSGLSDVAAAVRLSRAALTNIKENLFWAFFYNSIGIPLAAGVFTDLFGWTMNPMIGAAAMSLSSFCVVTNALRLNLIKIHDPKRDRRHKPVSIDKAALLEAVRGGEGGEGVCEAPGAPVAEGPCACGADVRTVHIGGMMCSHCEAAVKAALEALDHVVSVTASHEKGTALMRVDGEVDEAAVRAAVEAEDYEFISIE